MGGRRAAPRGRTHTMELPRRVAVGEGTIGRLGAFVASLSPARRVAIVSGEGVWGAVGRAVSASLRRAGATPEVHGAPPNDARSLGRLGREVRDSRAGLVAGVGGGRAVDAAKMAARLAGVPYVSVPTAASHDGIASPFVSVRGRRPHSLVASAPLGVLADIAVIRRAPPRLLASGCGDLVANIVAVRDWEIGRDDCGEYYGEYAANLAKMAAQTVIASARGGPEIRTVVEALISAGVAAGIAGSSRPCSGAEHLFSHALDRIAPGAGLHGEKCGIGSIMTACLQGQDWRAIRSALRSLGAPVRASDIGIGEGDVVRALVTAQSLRPSRRTILARRRPTGRSARRLARLTGVT